MSSSDPERGVVNPPHHRLIITRVFIFRHPRDHALPHPLTSKNLNPTNSSTIETSSERRSYAIPDEMRNTKRKFQIDTDAAGLRGRMTR